MLMCQTSYTFLVENHLAGELIRKKLEVHPVTHLLEMAPQGVCSWEVNAHLCGRKGDSWCFVSGGVYFATWVGSVVSAVSHSKEKMLVMMVTFRRYRKSGISEFGVFFISCIGSVVAATSISVRRSFTFSSDG